jgi:nitroreductase
MTIDREPLPPEGIRAVDHAITSRRSIRAFLPKPVPRATIEEILAVASRAPSGSNTQPWRVHVLTGAIRERLSAQIMEISNDPARMPLLKQEFQYYPTQWVSPFIDRRRACGWGLYASLGIGKGDREQTRAQHLRNYAFFDAPVGIMFTIDRVLELGSWVDYGMFIQNVMVAARARGLDTCPQAAFLVFHETIAKVLDLPANEQLVCGMSLGYADPTKPENGFVTDREPVGTFTRFLE